MTISRKGFAKIPKNFILALATGKKELFVRSAKSRASRGRIGCGSHLENGRAAELNRNGWLRTPFIRNDVQPALRIDISSRAIDTKEPRRHQRRHDNKPPSEKLQYACSDISFR